MRILTLLALAPILLCAGPQESAFCKMETQEDGLYCKTCKFLLEKKQLEKGKCWKCEQVPMQIKLCVKTYYACRGCPEKRRKPAKCCAGDMIKKTSKARILYQCKGTCSVKSDKPGTCSSPGCDTNGKKYSPYCEKNNVFPHGVGGW